MTIETKKVAGANEAIEIINRLNYRHDTFAYHGSTYSNDYAVEYRHFDAFRVNGEKDSFAITEIVVNGKLEIVRFFNLFRYITVELKLGDFNPDYSRYDQIINVDSAKNTVDNPDAKIILDRVVKVRRRGIKHVTTKQGRHMWYYFGGLISKIEAEIHLARHGFTIDEFIAAEKVAD